MTLTMEKLKPDGDLFEWSEVVGGEKAWPHDQYVPYGAITAYAVFKDGERIGTVGKVRTESYRKAGRLIAQTFHPLRWRLRVFGDAEAHYDYYSREEAVQALERIHYYSGG